MTLTLEKLNSASAQDALTMLDGLYEHSSWIAEKALAARPFKSLAHLKTALTNVVSAATKSQQLALLSAHPELAGKAMLDANLTAESASEQSTVGLTNCSPQELKTLSQLNHAYSEKFGFPFMLAVRGTRGHGLTKKQIIDTFNRRMLSHPSFEIREALRNVHRVVELRINDKFGQHPELGNELWDWHETLAQFSDPGFKENQQLTVTYLTDAHRACAAFIKNKMHECGFDSVEIDAVGNVVGIYKAQTENAQTLLTGSHYDTVRNAGKYDGRLGIFTPMACVRKLYREGKRLPFNIEVVGFAEEEGQRYKATFLGSGALTGDFEPAWLDQKDANGIAMRDAMVQAGLKIDDIPGIKRNPTDYLGFVEVHIEQGPVLNALDLPLGVVTSINGNVRYLCEMTGMACHAGTTPMKTRHDAALGAAELMLFVEKRAARDADSVGTVGMLQVPGGSINVVPGRCMLSLDMRAPNDDQRNALEASVLDELSEICKRRGLDYTLELTVRAAAAPSASAWQGYWEKAVASLGLAVYQMPSGAGHDAMKLHKIMPQAMLFVRGQNSGISHNPLESTTSDDIQLGIDAFAHLLNQLAQEQARP
ncbi:MAG: 2-oxo-4-hydroxy-4-carboxy-5-ureidoimidazoline decarboxylase [Vitreoscilla sp.]|nr:2-oxo-4-hydroxy-4-carboxy-5-ureidoimidazoline decarboxylase [Polaromonas sp.]